MQLFDMNIWCFNGSVRLNMLESFWEGFRTKALQSAKVWKRRASGRGCMPVVLPWFKALIRRWKKHYPYAPCMEYWKLCHMPNVDRYFIHGACGFLSFERILRLRRLVNLYLSGDPQAANSQEGILWRRVKQKKPHSSSFVSLWTPSPRMK